MFDSRQLAALAAVVRTGAFDAAAAVLAVTPSAVSQRIRALEEAAGTVLVLREQPCRATPTGARLVRHAEELARLDRDLAAELGRAAAGPARLRIAVNADSLATWVLPALAAVPEMLFDIVIDDQDHSAARLRRGEVAAALTSEPAPVQGCDVTPLGALRYLATATPAFAARWFPEGATAAALAAAPALIFDEKDALQHRWAEAASGRRVRLTGHRLPASAAFVEAALLGLGWGMNPEPLVREHVAAGRLVTLAGGLPLDTPLVWQASRIGRATLAPLTAAIKRAARGALRPRASP
jgi:LysR family transcriptional regulator, chromosome initiation inhibitor